MDDATPKPLHCSACRGGRVTPPLGVFGEALMSLSTTVHRHCLDCGYVMVFLNTSQLRAFRKKYGTGDDPAEATDSL